MIPLADQIVEVEKTVRDRARRYPDLVGRGRLKPETADQKLAAMRAVQSTLTWLEQNLDWIKPEAERRRRARQLAAEAAELARDPAVAEVLAAFPGAAIAAVRELAPGAEEAPG